MRIWRWDPGVGQWQPALVPRGGALDIMPFARVVALGTGCGGLLVKGSAAVNGSPALPLTILDDRDEIALGGPAVYVGVDPAEAAPFPPDGGAIECVRCRAPLRPGDAAVQCPSCRAWHHEGPILACWSYDRACAACAEPTAVVWEPDPLAASEDPQ